MEDASQLAAEFFTSGERFIVQLPVIQFIIC